jgi:hypothetical protein
LVASIEQAREALQATWVEWPRLDALLLVVFVRILAISDNEQQEWKLNTELTTAPGKCRHVHLENAQNSSRA